MLCCCGIATVRPCAHTHSTKSCHSMRPYKILAKGQESRLLSRKLMPVQYCPRSQDAMPVSSPYADLTFSYSYACMRACACACACVWIELTPIGTISTRSQLCKAAPKSTPANKPPTVIPTAFPADQEQDPHILGKRLLGPLKELPRVWSNPLSQHRPLSAMH